MTDPSSDELLSAYLDGELTAEEQARIERQLADSAELRQLLDDLRALRGGLESLPQYRLDQDFAARVLRRAEQAMLAGSATGEALQVAATAPAESVTSQPAVAGNSLERWKGVRTWGWAVAALAAGLVIMVFEQEKPAAQKALPAAPVPLGKDAEWIAVDQPRGESPRDIATKAESPASETGLAGKADVSATAATGGAAKGGAGGGAVAGPSATLSGAAAVPPNAIASDEKKEDTFAVIDELAASDMLVVNCTVTREAAQQRQFDRLLNERQIVLDGAENDKVSTDVAKFAASSPPSSTAPAAPMMKSGESAKQSSIARDESKNKPAASEGDVDAVLVDTTAGQISGVLADLNQNPKWFPSVQVEPAPQAAAQQSLTVYSRSGAEPSQSDRGVSEVNRDKIVGARKDPGQMPMNVQAPAAGTMAKSAAPQTQAQSLENVGANRNLQQGRAQRFAMPAESQNAQNLVRSRALSLNPNVASARNAQQELRDALPAEAARNLGQAIAGGRENEPAQQQFKLRGNLSNDARGANEETAPVRALFLLRVVDSPAAPASAAPQVEMSK